MKVLFAESHNLDRPDPLGSHHYIRLFQQEGHQCFWLGPAISPFHLLKPDALNRHRFRIWRKGGCVHTGIGWLVPFTLFFYYNRPLLRRLVIGRNQYRFCLPPLKKKLRRADFDQADLLWCAGPVAYSLLDLIPHRISCYRLADRLDQFSMIPESSVQLQEELIRRVDFVLATSRSLYEWAAGFRGHNIFYLPNGVSDRFFQEKLPKPDDFPAPGLPVAVYLGTLDTRFDIETLDYAVRNSREVYFLLIGPLTADRLKLPLEKLSAEPNFCWLGPRKPKEAIAYLQHSSVGIIPFYLNELTEAVNPIKYYEYLACGLPVVAPPLRELIEMKGPLHSYSDPQSFCEALSAALIARSANPDQYRSYAAGHTWSARFMQVLKIAGKMIDRKSPQAALNSGIWLSIVVIGQNEAANLPALFESLPGGSECERIYVDSGSKDGSAALARQLGAKVLVIDQDSVYAPGTGRYVGTLEASGRWILYLDGDMRLREEFKTFLAILKDREASLPAKTAGLVGRTINLSFKNGRESAMSRDYVVLPRRETGPPEKWGNEVRYHGGAVLYRREEVLKAGNWNPALLQLEEVELCSRILAGGGTIRALDLPMVEHLTPALSLKERLFSTFMPTWKGKKRYGAGQVVAAKVREGGLAAFLYCYPYPFIVLAGLLSAPLFYLLWPPLPLITNLAIAIWIGLKKRWYYYFVYFGNLLQIARGLTHYSPFDPAYQSFDQEAKT